MLMSHNESKGQRWPNVRFGELGDVSAAFSYGISELMMNNLLGYDFNMLEALQNHQFSGFPVQESTQYAVSDLALPSRLSVNTEHDRENDDPNSINITETINSKATRKSINTENGNTDDTDNTDMTELKVTRKRMKGPRTKRSKRTVFGSPWNLVSHPSIDLCGSVDNQGSAMRERSSGEDDVSELNFKNETGRDLDSESLCVGRWLEDMGFGRYAGVFEMHEVDEEALPLLTLDDLKEMGILAVGPRRKLYTAICQLRSENQMR